MHKLGRGHRDKVQQFMAITGTSVEFALRALQESVWNLDGAVDDFYGQRQIRYIPDQRHIGELYQCYRDPFTDVIMEDGISLLCKDLQVHHEDIVMLVLSWHMKAATMGEFSRPEFFLGLQTLRVDSIEMLRRKIPYLRSELKDKLKFREIYNFAFTWAKDEGQNSLDSDTAICMWETFFAERTWPTLFDEWCPFLRVRHITDISEDTWSQLLVFAKMVDPSLSNYDAEGPYPLLIDEFVEYLGENGLLNRSS